MGSVKRFVLAAAFLSTGLLTAQSPAPGGAVTTPVPTTKVLAIAHRAQNGGDAAQIRPIMPSEVKATVDLYLQGKLDQWFVRQDGQGVVFLLNAKSTEEAAAILSTLPLVRAKALEFDLIPLGPLSPLRYLTGEAGAAKQ